MSKEKSSPKSKGEKKPKFGLPTKEIVPGSVLLGFVFPFVLLICSSMSQYLANTKEFMFSLMDFLPSMILTSLIVCAVVTSLLLFSKGTLHKVLFSVFSVIVIFGYVQSIITTLTFTGMHGDGNNQPGSVFQMVVNAVLWVAVMALVIYLGVEPHYAKMTRMVLCFLLVIVTVMQTAGTVPSIIEYCSKQDETSADAEQIFYNLTDRNMTQLSSKGNILVFVIDRFDNDYYNLVKSDDPDFFDDLDGFTYYADNISTYPRTFPGIISMLTGVKNDFSGTMKGYIKKAYSEGTFLKDLKENGYKINLYTEEFYAYDNTIDTFSGLVDNLAVSTDYYITSYAELTWDMFQLASYFWAPDLLKSRTIGSSAFHKVVQYDNSQHVTDDVAVYDKITEEGFSTQSSKKTFTFMHLYGTHSPFKMDENCNLLPVQSNNLYDVIPQTKGCFKIIREYINALKEKGLYEDATIIITGDHGALSSDRDEYVDANLTALFVKESGQSGTPFKTSTAQVSQDNLHATIVKSANLKTDHDYGVAYSEIPEGVNTTRTHYFQLFTTDHTDTNLTYTITGPGRDFSNWKITSRDVIGYTYK